MHVHQCGVISYKLSVIKKLHLNVNLLTECQPSLNFWYLSTAITSEILQWHIFKYYKWVTNFKLLSKKRAKIVIFWKKIIFFLFVNNSKKLRLSEKSQNPFCVFSPNLNFRIDFHTKYLKLFVAIICVLLNTKFHNIYDIEN